jgi:hypothetical protein
MNALVRLLGTTRLRQRIALLMAVAVLLAGLAQAGHFHKIEAGQHNDTHPECLLCLHASGSAGPPAVARLVPDAVEHYCLAIPETAAIPRSAIVASYDARGPPLA